VKAVEQMAQELVRVFLPPNSKLPPQRSQARDDGFRRHSFLGRFLTSATVPVA
jgi:hypothetical protein